MEKKGKLEKKGKQFWKKNEKKKQRESWKKNEKKKKKEKTLWITVIIHNDLDMEEH